MSDIEEENMLTFRTGIGEISVGGFSRNTNSRRMEVNNIVTNSHRYRLDFPQHDARNAYHERALSPLSLRSDVGPPRFYPEQYANSHRSGFGGRSRSPMSFRSVDTTRSIVDITNALKFETFNTHELQMIKEVVCRKLKLKKRRRYEKNRHKSMVFKSNQSNIVRNTRSIDTSESLSSGNEENEDTLINTTVLRRPHISQVDNSLLMKSIKNNDQYSNHTIDLKKNVYSIHQKASNKVAEVVKPDSTQTCTEGQTLKDFFNSEYTFPSQRFHNTTPASENNSIDIPKLIVSQESLSSENEEIFSDSENRKRSFNHQINNSAKRIKLASPKTQELNSPTNSAVNCSKNMFKKPSIPKLKQNCNIAKEIVIAKSVPSTIPVNNINAEPQGTQNELEESKLAEVSMKSSFSKRKLFTQKVDLLSSKGISDTAGPSPQAKVDNKERNKARKLVTTQSCLNRNVSDEEDNVLDLIHKIVPAEQINTQSSNINKTNTVPDDRFDSDLSDTFTDETLNGTVFDINPEQNRIDKDKHCKLVSSSKARDCRVLPQPSGSSKSMFQRSNYIKSFWETDIESEMESENIPVWKIARPTANRDQFKDVSLTALNNTTHQVGKNRAKILTVQDLNNKIAYSKKRLNTATEIEEPNDREKVSSKLVNEQIPNEVQLEPEKTVKEKKKTVASSTKNKQNTEEDLASTIKLRKRTVSSNKSFTECKDMATKAKNSKTKKTKESRKASKDNAKSAKTNRSINTRDILDISSRTRSKQNECVKTLKENISELSDDQLNISVKSLRPRKSKTKNDTF